MDQKPINGNDKTNLNPVDPVQAIRKEAKDNEIFNAICYVLAHRDRTRSRLTARALQLALEKEGVRLTQEEYAHAFSFLASLGIGTLIQNRSGKVIGLNNIKYTLQSIGQVAASKTPAFKKFSKQNEYKKLHFKGVPEKVPTRKYTDNPVVIEEYKIALTLIMDGNSVALPTTIKIRPHELGVFLLELNEMTKRLSK